jgi:multiple antibiotic resistance protein
MNLSALGATFVTLFVIMDPIGNVPVFVVLTGSRPAAERRRIAVQAAAGAGALIVVFALFGRLLLAYLHVSVESVAIAGGLLLLLVALQMFQGYEFALQETQNPALVPLATPLLAGPGAIAAVMVLADQNPGLAGRSGVIAGIVAVAAVIGAALLLANQLARLLRPSGAHFLSRILALLLSAIAVQLIVNAVRTLITSPAGLTP